MRYITGIHALNLPCKLETSGDWHISAIQWDFPKVKEEAGLFSIAQGMNNDFICNSEYDNEIFDRVYEMKSLNNWQAISDFMAKEYKMKWINYLQRREQQ